MNTATKIILGNVIRGALIALITFLVTKGVLGADVKEKLLRGETTELYNGLIPLNLMMVVNVIVGALVPILVPIAQGIWSRLRHAYETIVARSNAFAQTKGELKEDVAAASPIEIIKTVAAEKPAQ